MKTKKGQMWGTLVPYIIAIGALVLIGALIAYLSGRGTSAIEYLKNFFRFGR